ncbi:MAG: signal peptidase I [Pyrinomonadaceae bacterium]
MKDDLTNTGVAEPSAEVKTEGTAAPASPAASRNGSGRLGIGDIRKTEGPVKSIWREYFESAVVTVIMALFGMTFIVQAVKVPTGSMQNTITIGDHLLVNKFIFAPGPPLPFLPMREIRRGDIIVFKYPGNPNNRERDESDPNNTPYKTNYVKRVVGLPGERIEIRGTRVFINGEPLPEQFVTAKDPGYGEPPDDLRHNAPLEILGDPPPDGDGPYTVYYSPKTRMAPSRSADSAPDSEFHFGVNSPYDIPPGHYYVMGDNRDNSSDSRVWGPVDRNFVIGRAMFVYWSYDESAASSGNPLLDFFSNTRWSRTGTMVK